VPIGLFSAKLGGARQAFLLGGEEESNHIDDGERGGNVQRRGGKSRLHRNGGHYGREEKGLVSACDPKRFLGEGGKRKHSISEKPRKKRTPGGRKLPPSSTDERRGRREKGTIWGSGLICLTSQKSKKSRTVIVTIFDGTGSMRGALENEHCDGEHGQKKRDPTGGESLDEWRKWEGA